MDQAIDETRAGEPAGIRHAHDLRPVTPDEANALEAAELDRFLALLDSLQPEEWVRPIPAAPRNWDVKALVAQVAGQYAAQANLRQLRRLANPLTLRFYHIPGRSLGETVRQVQVGDRLFRTPPELLAELREVGPRAIRNRAVAFRPLAYFGQPGERQLRLPSAPFGPFAAVRALWFHRFTVSTITGRPFAMETGHDDRIIEGILEPAAQAAATALPNTTVDFGIRDLPSFPVRFGGGDAEPEAAITLTPATFAVLASGRRNAAWVREHAEVSGNVRAATRLLIAIASAAEPRPY